tara:strand:+ start:4035 stop:5426 length:1392 start_codon:yes stop_codon:yes gene_type:complete
MKNSITQHLKNKSFFLIGIGGAGMMGIAELLHNMGFAVRGSDILENNAVSRLRKLKIKIFIGHNPKNIKQNDIVVFSNAIPRNNSELRYARKQGITILSRMEILAELMRLKYGISITGSHGKTTTTSLLGHILHINKLDPTYLIGGKLKTDDPHVKLGNSQYLVAETDESDPSFSILKPHLVVLTNLDKEHLDNYDNNYSNLEASMLKLINSIPFYGKVFLNGDDKNSLKLQKKINRNIFQYGFRKTNHLQAESIKFLNNKMRFNIIYGRKSYKAETYLLGKHNVYNILSAISVSLYLGISISQSLASLRSFYGASRRFDVYKNIFINGIDPVIIDDYGHHPTEIDSTIQTINNIYKKKKIIMIFQPHRFSRTKAYWRSFIKILNTLDQIILLPTYSAGEKNNSYDSNFLYKKLSNKNKVLLTSFRSIKKLLDQLDLKNTILVLQGAGDIKNIINILKKYESL